MAEAALKAEIAKLQAELDSERTKSAGASAMPKVWYLSRERKQTIQTIADYRLRAKEG